MFGFTFERPIAFFDIESTGTAVRGDRIVELAVVVVYPDKKKTEHTWRVNPEIPIPPEVTAIHGISDADVATCPTFAALARDIQAVFADCDLGGYNVSRFDIPMLQEEFIRAGMIFDVQNRRVVDAQRIFHMREPRDLTAALAFYCGEMHLDAHGAMPDVLATIRVLEGQYQRYHDLPGDIEALDELCNPRDPKMVDRAGRLKWIDGQVCLNFGKKKGTPLKQIIKEEPSFIRWMLRSDFPRDTQDIVAKAAEGHWPAPPEADEIR